MPNSILPAGSELMGQNDGQYLKNVQAVAQVIPSALPAPPQGTQNGAQLAPPPLMANSAMFQTYANYL